MKGVHQKFSHGANFLLVGVGILEHPKLRLFDAVQRLDVYLLIMDVTDTAWSVIEDNGIISDLFPFKLYAKDQPIAQRTIYVIQDSNFRYVRFDAV